MTHIHVDDLVKLAQDVPELGLRRGDVGLVCSTWFSPATAYEVEFCRKVPDCQVRALLMLSQIDGDADGFESLCAGEPI